jgi:hypothetical protein
MPSISTPPYKYINFPVHETIDIKSLSDVSIAVDKMVKLYVVDNQVRRNNFSFRILLPRDNREGKEKKSSSTTKIAKKIGLKLQIEFVLALKEKNVKPNIKEVRYIHDHGHYGWILASPHLLND